MIMLNKKLIAVLTIFLIGSSIIGNCEEIKSHDIIFGGKYVKEAKIKKDRSIDNKENSKDDSQEKYRLNRYFRPSNNPVLNATTDKYLEDLIGSDTTNVTIPDRFLKTPRDTVINYFSLLREASNPTKDTQTGCGTIGYSHEPYPIAYKFLADSYQKRLPYEQYLKSFKNILHINLIKANQLPQDKDNPDTIKYFVELETIEGTNQPKGVFAYYYGYIYLQKIDSVYKIVNMEYTPQNFLCGAYHGWSHDAKYFVEIKYGNWCHLVDGSVTIKQDGYEKRAYFKDKDGNEYYVLFYQLTNGNDIKIADYKKDKDGNWERIYINPEKCLEKNNNKLR